MVVDGLTGSCQAMHIQICLAPPPSENVWHFLSSYSSSLLRRTHSHLPILFSLVVSLVSSISPHSLPNVNLSTCQLVTFSTTKSIILLRPVQLQLHRDNTQPVHNTNTNYSPPKLELFEHHNMRSSILSAAGLVLAAGMASAQTFTDCNPTEKCQCFPL